MGKPDTRLGDGLSARFDGQNLVVFMPTGEFFYMTPPTMQALQSFLAHIPATRTDEADVWHEGSKSHYRAILLRKLTLDEIYRGLK